MRSKTVKENLGLSGKIRVYKFQYGVFEYDKTPVIELSIYRTGAAAIFLSIKRARELFEAGLQMCDELEQEK